MSFIQGAVPEGTALFYLYTAGSDLSLRYMRLVLLLLAVLFIHGCSNKKNDHEQVTVPPGIKKDTILPISVDSLGSLMFRRSYGWLEGMTKKEEREQKNALPNLGDIQNEQLRKRFEELGFVRTEYLLLKKIKPDTASTFTLGKGDARLNVQVKYMVDWDYLLTFEKDKRLFEYKLRIHGVGFKYILADVVPGGYPELIVYDEHYIMNGDNFTLTAYEIKGR